jgi:TRAP-type C4-dicarboxylate transport system substrate-binding protein
MSLSKFNELSQGQQEALLNAAKEAGEYERQLALKADQEEIEIIRTAGVQVDTFIDAAAWITAVQPVYRQFPQFDSLREKIQVAQQ